MSPYELLGHLLLSVTLISYLKKGIAELKKVQRRTERMTKVREQFLCERELCNPSGLESFSLEKNDFREGVVEVYRVMCATKKVGIEQLLTVYAKRRIRCHQPQLAKARIWCLVQWMDIRGTPHPWMLCVPKAEVGSRGPGRALRECESHCRLLTRQIRRG